MRLQVLMRELWLQMWHELHPDATSKFVTKGIQCFYLFLSLYAKITLIVHILLISFSEQLCEVRYEMLTVTGIMERLDALGLITVNTGLHF